MAKREEDEEEPMSKDEQETDSDDDVRAESDDDAEESGPESDDDESDDDESDDDESDDDESDDDESDDDESDDDESDDDALAVLGEEDPDGVTPTQLGAQRWVLTASFGAAALLAYFIGMSISGTWAYLGTRDFFALRFPAAAGIHDDSKLTYGLAFGGVVGIIALWRGLKNPEWRGWANDVAGELVKVKWPARKEVTNSTIVVLATSAVSTGYLFVLDRFWGFVTNLIYGTGSS